MPTRASARPTGTACLTCSSCTKIDFPLNIYSCPLFLPPCRELGDFELAMDSFQKALMLDQNHIQSLQLRGMMLYHHGSLQEAIGNFKVPRIKLAPIRHALLDRPASFNRDDGPALNVLPLPCCLSFETEVSSTGALQWSVPVHEGPESRGHGPVLRGHQSSDQSHAEWPAAGTESQLRVPESEIPQRCPHTLKTNYASHFISFVYLFKQVGRKTK